MNAAKKKPVKEHFQITLRVTEAQSKDVGRGIARIDPKDMESIGVSIGDVIEIEGPATKASAGKEKEKAVAKLMPIYMEERGRKQIQIDGILRDNAKVGLDEKVKVSKVAHHEAGRVVIKPLQMASVKDDQYLGRLFAGIPVIKGSKVRAILFGSKSRDFEVLETSPTGTVIITTQTAIVIKGARDKEEEAETGKPGVSYEDIGGLGKEIHRIREMIELPLKYPQVFDRLGIDPPKGVLLYGPPGTGKTLIARAVAHEADANFFTVNGPEIVHKFYGESEKHLREYFEKAAQAAPSILFIDEIDAIAPKRVEVQGEVEKRIVATLLAELDGLKNRGKIIVIGATNIPDVLDPALRRPGRFDREIRIGIPDRSGRGQILNIHTRGMPLAEDVDLERLADITHGFVGADLEALARESAMSCLRQIFVGSDMSLDEIPLSTLLDLQVTMDHFMDALKEVEPSAIREVFVEIPNVKWEDVGGLDNIKERLKESVQWPLQHAKLFEHVHVAPPKGILLEGPPGTGKTLIAKALANESEVNFISIKGPELMNKYVGEAEKGVRELFKRAKAASPCIIFFDEIDSIVPARGGAGADSGVTQRVISQFLTEMDGIEELKGVMVLGATNRKDLIDPALLRTGRFDFILSVGVPDAKTRERIFDIHTKGKPLGSNVGFDSLVKETEGMSGSDIEAICRRAGMNAMREFIYKHKEDADKKKTSLRIMAEDFVNALTEVKKEKR
ncbi:MAG: CDC48 family AAA ATPase [Pseudomonadota bacterium]